MKCKQCGSEIPDIAKFCPVCGTAVTAGGEATEKPEVTDEANMEKPETAVSSVPAAVAAPAALSAPEERVSVPERKVYVPDDGAYMPGASAAQTPPPAGGKKKSSVMKWIIAAAAAAVILCAIVIPILLHNAKQTRYNEAATLLEEGEYIRASEAFAALGSFDDAEEMVLYSQNKQAYKEADDLMSKGQYDEAAAKFAALGDFEDAAQKAVNCRSLSAYEAAKRMMENGSYEAAAAAFTELGNFEDSAALAEECADAADYTEAVALMDSGDYEGAEVLLADISTYKDAQDLYTYCENKILYSLADEAYAAGLYYDAYNDFDALGDFEDAASRCAACIQPFPGTGETYRNSAYSGNAVTLTINPPTDDGSCNYIKIYTEYDELVSCIAIGAGSSATIDLPSGTYKIKTAYGYGNWYGEQDLFGDDGYYQVITYDDYGTDIVTLEANYIYTLSLRNVTDVSGDPIDSYDEDRENF